MQAHRLILAAWITLALALAVTRAEAVNHSLEARDDTARHEDFEQWKNSIKPQGPVADPRSIRAELERRPAGGPGTVVDGAAFRCADGGLLHVSLCQGESADATCTLTELHKPGLQISSQMPRADIAARFKGCEAGGIRYGADNKPVFAR